jgi:tetratricopeptide (TPR) repeat protein
MIIGKADQPTRAGPYPGMLPFRQADHDRFFGRGADAATLIGMWRDNRLTIAVGPAGCGKTSLLRAGVFPLLAGTGADVLAVGDPAFGATFPAASLPEHNPYTLSVLRSWVPGGSPTRLAGQTVSGFIAERAGRRPVFAAIDQLEELPLKVGPRWSLAQRFMHELADALRPGSRLHLLLVIREDAEGVLAEPIAGGPRHRIGALAPEKAAEAIALPAAEEGRRFTEDAVDSFVADLRTSDTERFDIAHQVEPSLLQAALMRLWHALPADLKLITKSAVRAYGDVDEALGDHCSQILAAVADEHELSPKHLRNWLLANFVTAQGRRARVAEGPVSTAGTDNAVLRSLVRRHLLTALTEDGARSYKLLDSRLIEPLHDAAVERIRSPDPAEYLRAAEYAIVAGELELAGRQAGRVLDTASEGDFRLRAVACSLLGNLAREQDKPDAAAERYAEAAVMYEAVRDTDAVARQLAAAGDMLAVQGNFPEAVRELRAAADRMPNDPGVQTEFALALWKLGEGRAAVAVLTAALGIDGGYPAALQARGEILADLGEATDAIRDLDRVSESSSPSARAARGLALAELGDQSRAQREIDIALASNWWNGPALYYAARAAVLGGGEITARELARKAVIATDPALPPHHRDAARQLAGQSGAPG